MELAPEGASSDQASTGGGPEATARGGGFGDSWTRRSPNRHRYTEEVAEVWWHLLNCWREGRGRQATAQRRPHSLFGRCGPACWLGVRVAQPSAQKLATQGPPARRGPVSLSRAKRSGTGFLQQRGIQVLTDLAAPPRDEKSLGRVGPPARRNSGHL